MRARVVDYIRSHHVALLALFVALGGTSYAAISLPANSVGSRQLRNHSITPSKVAPRTIRLFRGQRGLPGLTGPQGKQGLQGTRGLRGRRGSAGATGPLGPTGPAGASALVGSWLPASTTATDLGPPLGANATAPSGATDADVAAMSPNAATVARDLAAGVTTAPATGQSWTVTLRVNGADTALTCAIGAGATNCDSGSTTVAVPAKSLISFKVDPAGGPASAPIYFGWRLTGS